jgi:hypothetical protein
MFLTLIEVVERYRGQISEGTLRNPGQLRRGERYSQTAPLKGVKIGARFVIGS